MGDSDWDPWNPDEIAWVWSAEPVDAPAYTGEAPGSAGTQSDGSSDG